MGLTNESVAENHSLFPSQSIALWWADVAIGNAAMPALTSICSFNPLSRPNDTGTDTAQASNVYMHDNSNGHSMVIARL
jgi:hypothetical protein